MQRNILGPPISVLIDEALNTFTENQEVSLSLKSRKIIKFIKKKQVETEAQ
jgi:hypothetical protein